MGKLLDWYSGIPRWLRIGLALAWMGTIWWLTSRSARGLPVLPWNQVFWNTTHVFAFGLLAGLLFLAGDGEPRRQARACLWAAVLTAGFGALTEINQAFLDTGRRADPWDALSDATGGVLFACGLLWLRTGSRRSLWVMLAMIPLAAVSVAGASGFL